MHTTGTRKEWLDARLELLKAEKELTRRSDELAKQRQALPWVRIDKEYHFETDSGAATLKDLFRGRSQLLVYHFMFGPDFKAGCPSCSMIADGFEGFAVHLANMTWRCRPCPRAAGEAHGLKRRMGWTFRASSNGSDFNFDFKIAFTEEQQKSGAIEYNYERDGQRWMRPPRSRTFSSDGGAVEPTGRPSRAIDRMSAFALEDGVRSITYSTCSAGSTACGVRTSG